MSISGYECVCACTARTSGVLIVTSAGSSGRSNSAGLTTWLIRTSSVCVRCFTRPGLVFAGLDPEASTGRQNRDLRRDGDPLVTPLGIVLRKSPRVGLARDERARTFSPHTRVLRRMGRLPIQDLAQNILVAPASDSLGSWAGTAASDPLCEMGVIELLKEQQVGVSRVFSAPCGAAGFHVDGRMLYGLYLLGPITSDERVGELNTEAVLVGVGEARSRKCKKRCRWRSLQDRELGSWFQSAAERQPPQLQQGRGSLPPHSTTSLGNRSRVCRNDRLRSNVFLPATARSRGPKSSLVSARHG